MAYIKVENLKYRYPNTTKLALDGLDFEIEKGSFIGIVGENGAGKSTLCQAFNGLIPGFFKGAYGGKVLIEDTEVAKTTVSKLCQKVGLVFQNPFNQLSGAKETVFEEIAFGLQNFGVPKEEMISRVDEVMELLDIAAYRDRNPFDLSGGQMQRVALAGILAMKPEVIVLDEPTSQLDPAGSEEVLRRSISSQNQGSRSLWWSRSWKNWQNTVIRFCCCIRESRLHSIRRNRFFQSGSAELWGESTCLYKNLSGFWREEREWMLSGFA